MQFIVALASSPHSMSNRRLRRRDFLKWSAASLTALGAPVMPSALRRAGAAPALNGKKVLFIFLRGGLDAAGTVIPFGDQGIPGQGVKTYLQARPKLASAPGDAHDLNGFSSLHPKMQVTDGSLGPQVARIFHGTHDERGAQLALVHRVGYESQNRSHFSSQQFWENGVPGDVLLEKGIFNNYLTAYPDASSPLSAATLNSSQMILMRGDTVIPAMASVDQYALPQNVLLGTAPTAQNPLGTGLRGAYGQSGFDPSIPNNSLLYSTGRTLLDSLQFFEDNVQNIPYSPEAAAVPYYDAISEARFARAVRDSARLLKQVEPLRISGCNQDGYDTHGGQGSRLPVLLRDLGLALTALYEDLKPIWNDVLIMTMSEFGRTSEENGNNGTDHGEASLMFILGGSVRGGVYNCDASTWDHGDLFSTANGRYVAHRTDFRAVYHEILTRHLEDPDGRIDAILPRYSQTAAADTQGFFTPLGFLA